MCVHGVRRMHSNLVWVRMEVRRVCRVWWISRWRMGETWQPHEQTVMAPAAFSSQPGGPKTCGLAAGDFPVVSV